MKRPTLIAVGYILLGGLWIAFSDMALASITEDLILLSRLQTAKGVAFVLFTGLLLFWASKTAQQQVGRTKLDIHKAIGGTGVPSAIVDEHGFIRYASATLADLVGVSPNELTGTVPAVQYLPPDVAVQLRQVAQHVWEQDDDVQPAIVDGALLDAAGNVHSGVFTLSRLREADGLLVSFLDLSERQALQRELEQAQKMEAVGRLAGGVAHDFNNLLTAIGGYADIVEEQIDDPEVVGDLAEIHAAVSRATDLTQQILLFSRGQAVDIERIELNAVIRETKEMLQQLIGADVHLELDLEPREIWIDANLGQLEQVLTNLAVNARDAMPEGGILVFSTRTLELGPAFCNSRPELHPGSHVRIQISDSGMGMNLEVQNRIFEPFYTTKTEGKGTGLGLATSYGIIQALDGAISVYSNPGMGTTFTIHLPLANGDTVFVDPMPRSEAPRFPLNIVLLEDEDAIRRYAVRLLERNGHSVWSSENAVVAIEQFQQLDVDVDVIVSDVVFGQDSGPDVVEILGRDHADIPVLYVSGYAGKLVANRMRLDRRTGFLQKPFTEKSLLQGLGRLLDA